MSYAVRNDGVYGVRAVNSTDDCLENEYFSETFVEAPVPNLTVGCLIMESVSKA